MMIVTSTKLYLNFMRKTSVLWSNYAEDNHEQLKENKMHSVE